MELQQRDDRIYKMEFSREMTFVVVCELVWSMHNAFLQKEDVNQALALK